jgi:hypothetical protein
VQRHLSEATKGIILLQRQLTPPAESPPPQPMTLSATVPTSRADRQSPGTPPGTPSRRFSRWRFWRAA